MFFLCFPNDKWLWKLILVYNEFSLSFIVFEQKGQFSRKFSFVLYWVQYINVSSKIMCPHLPRCSFAHLWCQRAAVVSCWACGVTHFIFLTVLMINWIKVSEICHFAGNMDFGEVFVELLIVRNWSKLLKNCS